MSDYNPNVLKIIIIAIERGSKVEIFLEQREVAFLSPSKSCENLISVEKFKVSQILQGDKNATSLCSRNISTLKQDLGLGGFLFQ